jgi:hypothetical protein
VAQRQEGEVRGAPGVRVVLVQVPEAGRGVTTHLRRATTQTNM